MHYSNLSEQNEFTIRLSTQADLGTIMELIHEAQADFKEAGIDQWQDGYPNETSIEEDIKRSESYVMLSDHKIIATAMISFRGEPTYDTIEGEWLTNNPYAVIHRVAVCGSMKGKRIAGTIINHTASLCKLNGVRSIRIDTHLENKAMQRAAVRAGFGYCGIITLTSGATRLAYELIL